MAFEYIDGRLHIRFGASSRFSQLFAEYDLRLQKAIHGLLPTETLDNISESFQAAVYQNLSQKERTEVDKAMDFFTAQVHHDFLENPTKMETRVAELTRRMHLNESSDFTASDYYRGLLGQCVADYLEIRLDSIATYAGMRGIGLTLQRMGAPPSMLEKIPVFHSQLVRPEHIAGLIEQIDTLQQKVSKDAEGLKDAILTFHLSSGETYSHDRRRELTHGIRFT